MICPRCGADVYEWYAADKIRRWRCFGCNVTFSGAEGWQVREGELVRVLRGESYCAVGK